MTDPLSPGGLERFAEVAASHVGSDKIPGLVAVVSREDQVHVEALGSGSVGGPPDSKRRPVPHRVDLQAGHRRSHHGVGG